MGASGQFVIVKTKMTSVFHHLSRVIDNEFRHNIVKVVYGSDTGTPEKLGACGLLPKTLTF